MEKQKTPPSLRELQLWMKWIVTDPRGVQDALANPFPSNREHLERYTSPKPSTLPWISESGPIDKAMRLDIYAEAYFTRVLESMRADFQITEKVLGEISFKKLVADYLKQHPSRHYNIGEVGRDFSKFVAGYEDLSEVSFLKALIEMEWLLIESFYANDTGVLEAGKLQALSDEDWATAEFKLASSVKLLQSNWPLDQFWKLSDESAEVDSTNFEKLETKKFFLLVREQGSVRLESLSTPEHCLLQKLKSGVSLMTALDETLQEFKNADVESEIMNWFNVWVGRGIICDVQTQIEKVNL